LEIFQEWKKTSSYYSEDEIPKLYDAEYWTNKYNIYCQDWLYYASFSPIWLIRLREFGAQKNELEHTIDFQDDVSEHEFHDYYNYENDELPLTLVLQRVVTPKQLIRAPIIQQSWLDFHENMIIK